MEGYAASFPRTSPLNRPWLAPSTTFRYSSAVRGDVAYLAAQVVGPYPNQSEGVIVIDVSDPSKLRRIGMVDTYGEATQLELVRDRLYLADGTGGLRVFDVSAPDTPRDIGGVDLGPGSEVLDAHVVGARAYLAAGGAGVVAVDLGPDLAPTRGAVDLFLPSIEASR